MTEMCIQCRAEPVSTRQSVALRMTCDKCLELLAAERDMQEAHTAKLRAQERFQAAQARFQDLWAQQRKRLEAAA